MNQVTRLAISLVLLLFVGGRVRTAPVAPAETLYNDAMAKERAVRQALGAEQPPPTLLKAVRTVVEQYELLVRTYPTSGYCDDALWQGGQLSLEAYSKFRDARDRDAAIRLHKAIASEYPSSKYAKQVTAEIARVGAIGAPLTDSTVRAEAKAEPVRSATAAPASPSPANTPAAPDVAAPATAVSAQTPAAIAPALSPSSASAPIAPALSGLATIKDIRRTILADVVRVTIELDAEVKFHEERLSDPPRVFVDLTPSRAVPALVDQTIRFDGDNELVRQIRLGRHPNNTTRIVLEAAGVSSFSVYPLYNPYRLVIDSARAVPSGASTALTPPAVPVPPSIPLATRTTGVVRATIPVPALLPSRQLSIAPFKLTVTAREGAALLAAASAPATGNEAPPPASVETRSPAPAPAASPPAAPSTNTGGGFSMARQLGLGVSKIVIDPGHGGHDPGAKGNGMTEAELVLDVALRLEARLLKLPGIQVVLTRRTDEFIPLQERTAIANREHADLFLSIHANASTNKQARGVESYFLNIATTPSAEAVAARENATSGQSMGDATKLVNAILLNNKLDESRDLALLVQRSMLQNLQGLNKTLRDLGVKQAPFVVLIGASMPSVLSEISFLTNTQDAKLLKTSAYREKVAEALFNALRKYQTSLKDTGPVAGRPQ